MKFRLTDRLVPAEKPEQINGVDVAESHLVRLPTTESETKFDAVVEEMSGNTSSAQTPRSKESNKSQYDNKSENHKRADSEDL